MESNESLYISIKPRLHKDSRSNFLDSQASFLKIMKHLRNIHVLSRKRNDLKNHLYKTFSSISSDLRTIKQFIPEHKLPKELEEKFSKEKEEKEKELKDTPKKSKKKSQKKSKSKEDTSFKPDDIDEELKQIQEKLALLNS